MVDNLNKKGFSPNILIVVTVMILIGLLAGASMIMVFKPQFKASGVKLGQQEEKLNISNNLSVNLDVSQKQGVPSDSCGNGIGLSLQDPTKKNEPYYNECIKIDCCEPYVYEQVLDFGKIVKDKFVYLFYYVNGTSSHHYILFYYSRTGRDSDWHKFYQTDNKNGNHSIILPIGEEFRFIKLLGMKSTYIDYAEGEVLPWDLGGGNYLDVCNHYNPEKTGVNYFYNESGEDYSDLILEKGKGYIISMKEAGKWTK